MPTDFPTLPLINPPPALAIDTGAEPVIQAIQFKTQATQYAAELLNIISQYVTGFNSNITDYVIPGESEGELADKNELANFAAMLKSKVDPLITALATNLSHFLSFPTPSIDIQQIVDDSLALITEEITLIEDEIKIWRPLITTIIHTALLDSSYEILSSDSDLIQQYYDAYVDRNTSMLTSEMFLFERKSLNYYVLHGLAADDMITRVEEKKGRLLREMLDKAQEIKVQMTVDAFNRAIERMRTKIQAGAIIPKELLRLPTEVYGLLNEIIRRMFPDPETFIGAVPSIISNTTEGFRSLSLMLQEGRLHQADLTLKQFGYIFELFKIISDNLTTLGISAGKLATTEATG